MTNDLVISNLETAKNALALAQTIQQKKGVLDIAQAAKVFAKRQKLGEEIERQATAIIIEAKKQIGQELTSTPRNTGTRTIGGNYSGGNTIAPPDEIPTLEEIGLTKRESAEAQRIYQMSVEEPEIFERVQSGEITANKAYKEVKAQQKKENRKQEDTIPANTAYNVQSGQVWNCGKHIVICGDAYKIDTQADAIITDPPYGIDYKPDWNKWDGSKSDFNPIIGDKNKFNPAPFLNYKTVLLFGANYYSDLLPLGGWLCWDKRTKEELDDMFGSPFELAWYRSAVTTKKSIMIRLLHGGVVNADSVNGNNEKRYHATQKPIELMREIMELLVRKTDVILDPFAGSGTTMLACERLGIKSISIDIDPSNVEIILQRYEKETGVKPCQA